MTFLGSGTFGGPTLEPTSAGVLAQFRSAVAAVLDVDPNVSVFTGPVDAVEPPAYLLVWPDQNLTMATACWGRVRLQVVCVGPRMDPDPGYDLTEQLVETAVVHLSAAGFGWEPVGAYLPFQIGGLDYLAARITVTGNVSLEVVP